MLFTKKTASVPHHKGQFSFPGGVVEQRDGSRVETALREAWEEIRLPAEAVEVLGLLDDTETRATNFIITPVVGIVRDHVDFAPDGREIERGLRDGQLDTLSPKAFQSLMAALCKNYSAQIEAGNDFLALGDRNAVSPTEITKREKMMSNSALWLPSRSPVLSQIASQLPARSVSTWATRSCPLSPFALLLKAWMSDQVRPLLVERDTKTS